MNWINLWNNIFGTTEWLGINIGFWVSMGVIALLTVVMNVVFWSMKPRAASSVEVELQKNSNKK